MAVHTSTLLISEVFLLQLHMLASLTSTVSSFIREMHVQFKKKRKTVYTLRSLFCRKVQFYSMLLPNVFNIQVYR